MARVISLSKYYQFKMKKDVIWYRSDKELAAVIQEQQQAVREEFGTHRKDLLFPTPKMPTRRQESYPRAGLHGLQGTLIKNLNTLSGKPRILLGPDGSVYHFTYHQFRHTTATRMINNGVPQHIVQRYLGHETPTMTSTYAHIMDETLKKEFAAFQGKMVDINGKIYEPEDIATTLVEGSDPDDIDAQWLKPNICRSKPFQTAYVHCLSCKEVALTRTPA